MNAFTKKMVHLCMTAGIMGQSLECMEPLIKGAIPVKHTIISTALRALLSYDFTHFKKMSVGRNVLAVVMSPDGKALLTGSGVDNLARLWNVATGELIKEFKGHTSWVSSVAFSPDGKNVLTGSFDGTARLWDIKSGGLVKEFRGHRDIIFSVAFSPDGKTILTGSGDATVRLWDVETGEQLEEFTGIKGLVRSVAFSLDGIYAAAESNDHKTRLWDIKSGRLVQEFNEYPTYSLAFSPDGRTLLMGSLGEAYLWNIVKGMVETTFKVGAAVAVDERLTISRVAFSPDGNTVIIGTYGGSVSLWDIEEAKKLKDLIHYEARVKSIAYSRDGTMIETASGDEVDLWKLSGDSGEWIKTRMKAAEQLYKEKFALL